MAWVGVHDTARDLYMLAYKYQLISIEKYRIRSYINIQLLNNMGWELKIRLILQTLR